MAVLDWETIAGLVYDVGLRGEAAATAVAITEPESSRDFAAHNYNLSTGDDSWGGWMINMLGDLGPDRRARYNLAANEDLLDPATNARVMYGESGGGTNWSPWTTFNHGRHAPYMADARAAVAAVEARGGNPGGGRVSAQASSSAVSVDLGRSPDVLTGLIYSIDPNARLPRTRNLDGFVINGGQGAGFTLVVETLTGGHVQLGVDDIAELSLEVGADLSTIWDLWATLADGIVVDWWDLQFVVAGQDFTEGERGTLRFVASCRAQGPTLMRKRAGNIERAWARQSPTEVMNGRATEAGLRFVGEGSNRRDQIIRKGPPEGAAQMPTSESTDTESDWDLGQRLAKEEGYWCFESAGTLYFGRPSWLATVTPHFDVKTAGLGDLDAIDDAAHDNDGTVGLPECHWAKDDDVLPGMPPRTISVKLPRNRGEQVRPGMVADFDGIPGFRGGYLVSRVSYPIDGGVEPTQVDLVDIRDPVPEPPPSEDPGDGTTEGDAAARSTAVPVGTSGRSALDMVTVALRQIGKQYVYGAEAALDDPDPTAFDCSELVQWACAQVGVTIADGSYAQLDAVTRIDVDQARNIRGALLFPQPDAHHVAISLGDGEHTVEAMGRQYGVVQGNIGSRFGAAGLVPGLDYGVDNPSSGQPVRQS